MKTTDWEATRLRDGLLARLAHHPTWPDVPPPYCQGCITADGPLVLLWLNGPSKGDSWCLCRRCLTNLQTALDGFLATPDPKAR